MKKRKSQRQKTNQNKEKERCDTSLFSIFAMKKIIHIAIIPRSSKNEVTGPLEDGSYKVRVTSPPIEGEANKKLIELLSEYFAVPKSTIQIVKGERGRKKTVEIEQ